MRRLAAAASFIVALAAVHPAAADWPGADDTPHMTGSLCRAPETVLFTCNISSKVVSICAQPRSEQAQGEYAQDGGAVYRFGRPGHVELEATACITRSMALPAAARCRPMPTP